MVSFATAHLIVIRIIDEHPLDYNLTYGYFKLFRMQPLAALRGGCTLAMITFYKWWCSYPLLLYD
jgi:hypothetical protein